MSACLQGPDGLIILADHVENNNLEAYCQQMSSDATWADHVLVLAMAQCLQTDIMIITSSPGTEDENPMVWIVGQEEFDGQPLWVGHSHENHYQSLCLGEV